MKIGKVPENVLKRSVLRQIQTKRNEIISGAGIGEDCAIFSFGSQGIMMTCVQTAAVKAKEAGLRERQGTNRPDSLEKPERNAAGEPVCREAVFIGHLIQRCANNLAASGAQPVGIVIALTIPEEAEEPDIKALMADAEVKCRELNIQIAGGQTCVSGAVRQPVAAVTGYGSPFAAYSAEKIAGAEMSIGTKNSDGAEKGGRWESSDGVGMSGKKGKDIREKKSDGTQSGRKEKVQAGQDIVVSKWIGLEGTAILAERYREKLFKRYPAYIVDEAAGFERLLSVIPEAATAMKSGVCMMHDASKGGIFGALWELAEKAGVGLTIDLKKLPLRQETVEVCECCNVNPYELLSGGALVMVTKDGPGLLAALEAEKIPAAIVGRITDSNDRIIRNGEETRFLDRPKNDEIYRQ